MCAVGAKVSCVLRKLLPDLCDVVGDKCTKILERGDKLELDMIGSKSKRVAGALRSLMVSARSRTSKPGRGKC